MLFIQEGITNLRKRQNLWLGYFTKKKKKKEIKIEIIVEYFQNIFPLEKPKIFVIIFLLPYTSIILNTLKIISNNYYEKFDSALVN